MKKASLLILAGILCTSYVAWGTNDIPSSCLTNSHDIITLNSWGPYSKRYAGISHIPDLQKGIRFDFSVMPGYYRNRQLVPHVLFESSYYPWNISPEMDRITYRYELEWKDRVYADVTYFVLNDSTTYVEMDCVNRTDINQNLTLNLMAYIDYENEQPRYALKGNGKMTWQNAIDYQQCESEYKSPQYNLIYDGAKRYEERTADALSGFALGKEFGKNEGDRVSYRIDVPAGKERGILMLRYRTKDGETARFRSKGLINGEVELKGHGDYTLAALPYTCNNPGVYTWELCSEGTAATSLDGFFIGNSQDTTHTDIVSNPPSFTPIIYKGENGRDITLKYALCDNYYGIAWNYTDCVVREVLDDNLESFFRKKTHDHVSHKLTGNRKWHYANAFLRPIILTPNSHQTISALLCTGTAESVKAQIARFHQAPDACSALVSDRNRRQPATLPAGKKYAFGNQMLQAALLSNVVYPVHTQGQYIRHFTPGKNWNSLYTWDSGFIAEGLIDIDPIKAFECIRAYTTERSNQSAFIHHGTPLPIQMYATFDLWNHLQDKEALAYLYPRLKQFFNFMTGACPTSTTRMKNTWLLRTWDYFYNSGGWDDYPPQKALKDKVHVTPVVSTAYYIRAAKILRLAAQELGLKKDVKTYEQTIKKMTYSLQTYSWDEGSGYFSYVIHDDNGNAKDIYRYKDGSNFNQGMDGTSPLIAGICTPMQIQRLLGHLFSPDEMWTPVGISTVDQSAPYFRNDGYWNGAVWFPHQWLTWKALLDLGEGDKAYQVASTALDTWEKECRESYYTFEHFIISSRRGAGWHQFSGLSSPLLNWYAAYFRTGKVSTGFEIWLKQSLFNKDYTRYDATLTFDDTSKPHERTMLVCMNPANRYEATFNGKKITCKERHDGLVEITLPATNLQGRLCISPRT